MPPCQVGYHSMLQNETLYYITNCYSLVTLASVNHYICDVVNTSFFLICVDIHIHITHGGGVAPAYPRMTCACHVRTRNVRQVSAHKTCVSTMHRRTVTKSMPYPNVTTVMESVAILKYECYPTICDHNVCC